MSPASASGKRDTKQEDQVSGNSRQRITSVISACEWPIKTSLASRSISVKIASSVSTDKQRRGPEKSRSICGKNRGGGTCNIRVE